MTRLPRRQFVILATAAAGVCASGLSARADEATRVSVNRAGQAIDGYDTRAYWTVEAARDGTDAHQVDWNGAIWRFATPEDAAAFAATPDRFAPRFGGFCTRAMSMGRLTDGDPQVWRIHDGALYLFAAPKGGRVFDKDPEPMIALARAEWETLGRV
ncbi:YHS domain-containing (seleno)protein [Sulfitobacter sp. HNIBRBA3233]|uniref:YHS domain-containing (seleno)protein n=1 Tax=Sulfitobacter marinivivus TaxID=3158558 RepID=UPI0032DF8BD7